MGSTTSSYNASELTGYEPLVEPKDDLIWLQLEAIKLGIHPLRNLGYNSKLDLDPKVKKAMKDSKMVFTFKRRGNVKRYSKTPKSKKMLEKQINFVIKRNERRKN